MVDKTVDTYEEEEEEEEDEEEEDYETGTCAPVTNEPSLKYKGQGAATEESQQQKMESRKNICDHNRECLKFLLK